jgi:predicted XRE-type DNA-binding protein
VPAARKTTTRSKAADSPNVFAQLGFSPEESQVAMLKVELLAKILEIYRSSNHTKTDIARIWGKPHSRVSEILSGKLHLVGVETLIGLLEKMGAVVRITVEMKAAG